MRMGFVVLTTKYNLFNIKSYYPLSASLIMSNKRKRIQTGIENNSLIDDLTMKIEHFEKKIASFNNDIKEMKILLASITTNSINLNQPSKRAMHHSAVLTSQVDGLQVEDGNKHNLNTENGYVIVYTDGACENNGRVNAKAGIGVYFGEGCSLNVSQPVVGRATNNTAEIQACISALKIAHEQGIKKLKIKTDSQFVINSITQWIHKWKKNNWKVASGADVKNKSDFVVLDSTRNLLEDVQWEYVEGHKGHIGNEEADKLARRGASLYKL